jgi:hypothetical protein
MTALNIYGPYVVAAGVSLSYTDPTTAYDVIMLNAPSVNPVLVLPENVIEPMPSGPPHADSTLTILGSVSIAYDTETLSVGIGEVNGASNSPSFVTIGPGGGYMLDTYGQGWGYWGEAPFTNNGSFYVYGRTGAVGVRLDDFGNGKVNSLSGFDNTGVFTVMASNTPGGEGAIGVENVRDHFFNSGTITVSGGGAGSAGAFIAYGTTVTNSGAITADTTGFSINGPLTSGSPAVTGILPPMTITNSGVITAPTAIEFPSGALPPIPFFVNGAATALTTEVIPILHLVNSGTINGDIIAGGWFNESGGAYAGSVIQNTGAINGKVTLDSGGQDTYDGRGGTLSGGLYLGEGAATVYLGNDGETVYAGAGSATVYGGSGADTIIGGAGNDILSGGGGQDTLNGGGGLNTALYAGAYRQYVIGAGWATVSGGPEAASDTLTNIQRIQFVDGYMAYSATDTAAEVYRLYEAALDRLPDPVGLAGWTHALNNGESLQAVAASFVTSQEFQNTYGALDNTHFITLLYANVLHRLPDPGGMTGWMNYMAEGHTQADVLLGFSQSQEDINDSTAAVGQGLWIQDAAAAEVARLYDAVLGRLPDIGGLTGWTQTLEQGLMTLTQVAQDFVASTEFQNIYGNLTDTQFVTKLYENALHREPDTAGLTGWVNYLGEGNSRAQVVLDFSESQEHINDTAAHINNGIWLA